MEIETLYNYEETSNFLHVSVSTLRNWVSKKRIKHLKIGSKVFFTYDIIQDFFKKSIVESVNNNGGI
jgi:excisionase family DNA binding protein